jgi:hypothetical protein
VLPQIRGARHRARCRTQAVAEVFNEIDETELLEQALERRLRRGARLNDPARPPRAPVPVGRASTVARHRIASTPARMRRVSLN